MKIMHIAGGGDRGGAKPHIISLCSRLMQNHELELVSLRSGEFAEDAAAAGINTRVIYSRFVPLDYIRLIRHALKERPDIVHCHGAKANMAGVLLKLFCKLTVSTTIHSDWRLDYMHSFIKRNTIGRLNSLALKYFDYYITVSDNFKKMLISRGFNPLKMMTIYNGLDFSKRCPPFDRAEYLRSYGLDYQEGDIVMGIPARLTPVKDIPTLLRAFAKARLTCPTLKLIIGGDGEDMNKLRALSRELDLGRNVCFMGWINDSSRFFAACDIDVLSSISESFPYSVLEGIREGCAVITSDVGGMRRLIDHGENGYIFAPKDVDSFAQYMVDLAQNDDKRRLFAERLFEKASSLYSLEGMADTQSEIYRRIQQLKARRTHRDGVLICGAYGRNNSGDEAILKAIITSIRKLDPLIPLTVMTRQPRETSILHEVHAIYTFHFPRFLRVMGAYRLFINGGGNLIQDVTSSRSLYYYLFTILSAKKCGCRVLMYGCGIGHVRKKLNRTLSQKILSRNVDIITLRDEISRRELEDMRVVGPEVRMSADPAIGLNPSDGESADRFLREQGIPPEGRYICFALRPWQDFNRFEVYAEAAEYAYRKHGLTALFFPFEVPRDLGVSQITASMIRTPYFILDTPSDVELSIALLKKMDLVCAMRLHALVFAASAGVPLIATSYDIKVNGFMRYVGSEACRDLGELDAEWLCHRIDEAVSHPVSRTDAVERLRRLEAENVRAAQDLLA